MGQVSVRRASVAILTLSLLILLLMTAAPASANIAAPGGTWYWQNPTPQGNTVYGLCFADLNVGWAVGEAGTIRKTADGGATWTPQVSPVREQLRDVAFADANVGWAVSDAGTIIGTTNGGTTWTAQTSGVATGLNKLYALDNLNVYAAGDGGVILHTTDGGATAWAKQLSPTAADLNGVTFRSLNNGWVVGDGGRVLRTNNGGLSWFFGTSNTAANLNDVAFTSLYEGWAVGDAGEIRHTINGGASWSDQSVATTDDLIRIVLASSGAWLGGNNGRVMSSVDGGENWDNAASGTNRDVWTLAVNGSDVRFAGESGYYARAVDGVTFTALWMSVVGGTQLNDLAFFDASNGWAAGAVANGSGVILRTADKGANWFRQESNATVALNDVAAASFAGGDANHAWAVGNRTGGVGPVVTTIDGGLTWTPQTTGVPNRNLNGVDFVSLTVGWAVGDSAAAAAPVVITSGNGGANWTAQTGGAPVNSTFTAVDATSTTNACATWTNAAGIGGGVQYTLDGGATAWHTATVPALTQPLMDVDMIEGTPTVGYAVGGAGTILKTVDAGVNWTAQTSNTTEDLYGVTFAADGLSGIAVGDAGTVVTTGDGGTTWTVQPWSFSSDLRGAASFTDSSGVTPVTTDWICGTYANILSSFDPNTLAVTNLKADAGDTKITVSWTNPTSDFGGVMVYYSTVRCASSVYDTYGQELAYEGTGTSLERTGLENYKQYYFSVFVRNAAGMWSDAQTLVVVPIPTFKVTLACKPSTQTAGRAIKFTGKVTPAGPAAGKKISIQKFTGSWKTFATATVKADGSYAVSKKLSRGSYKVRAYMPGVAGKALAGYSASRYATWR